MSKQKRDPLLDRIEKELDEEVEKIKKKYPWPPRPKPAKKK
jgi:hypothetical protein